MGSKKSKRPPKPVKAPPPVEDISGGTVAGAIESRAATRMGASRSWVTKGQTMGKAGEVMGAGSTELADVSERYGVNTEVEKGELLTFGEFKGGKKPGSTKYGFSAASGIRGLFGRRKRKKMYKKAMKRGYARYLKKPVQEGTRRLGGDKGAQGGMVIK